VKTEGRRRGQVGGAEGARSAISNMSDGAAQEAQDQGGREGRCDHGVDANFSLGRESAQCRRRHRQGDRREVATAADVQKRIDQLKKDGKKTALLLVATRRRCALRCADAAVRSCSSALRHVAGVSVKRGESNFGAPDLSGGRVRFAYARCSRGRPHMNGRRAGRISPRPIAQSAPPRQARHLSLSDGADAERCIYEIVALARDRGTFSTTRGRDHCWPSNIT